jgi:hypothetical protein
MDKTSAEFGEILLKVSEKYSTWMAGRTALSVKELFELQDRIRPRTDLNKTDEQLTNEQGAWKIVYQKTDEMLIEVMGVEKKREMDHLRKVHYAFCKLLDKTILWRKLIPL